MNLYNSDVIRLYGKMKIICYNISLCTPLALTRFEPGAIICRTTNSHFIFSNFLSLKFRIYHINSALVGTLTSKYPQFAFA